MTNLERVRFIEIFYNRFMAIGDVAYLESAIPLVETLVTSTRLREMDPCYVQILFGVVDASASRLGVFELLGKIIDWIKAAVKEIPPEHPDRAALLDILGYRLSEKYEIFGEVEDLEQAIQRAEESVAATSLDDPDRAGRLSNLGSHLSARYELSGAVEDLEQAIQQAEKAVTASPLDHTNLSAFLNNLGTHLSTRYIISGSVEDLEKAMKCAEEALTTAGPEDLDRATLLSNVGERLLARYELSGVVEELQRSIKLAEEALAATPTDQAVFLSSLSSRLWTRYRISGVMEDLEQAIKLGQETLAVTPPGHTARIRRLNALGVVLAERYKRLGATEDLEQAIVRSEEALVEAPPGHTLRATSLSNLGTFLSRRYERLGMVEDLERAIKRAEQAVAATPLNHTHRAARLNNLGTYLSTRYEISGSVEDLKQAIKWTEESVAAPTVLEHIDRAMLLNNLGHRLFARYAMTGVLEDLEQAIKRAEEAATATPPDHVYRGSILVGLASHLTSRYEQTYSRQDFYYTLRTLYSAWHCYTSPPLIRIEAARRASLLLALKKMWQDSSSILTDAVILLPKVSSRSIGRNDQEYRLSQTALTRLASDSVSLALQAGEDAYYCLRLFELGRGVIMGLVIDCRSDLSELQEEHPEIFEKFHSLRVEVDSFLGRINLGTVSDVHEPTYEEVRDRQQLVADQLDETLASIRELPGFEGFQLPPHADYLMSMASDGPIVLFNSTEYRSDAIIVTSSGIKALRLQALRYNEAEKWMSEMRNLPLGKRSTYPSRNKRMLEMLQWLWDAAVEPVCNALQLGPVANDTDLPRVWWIGVGPLAMAPFHAAGDHRPKSTNNTMSRAISSYIPTIKALSYARQKKFELLGKQDSRVLLVTMTNTPGRKWNRLSKAAVEAKEIVSLVGKDRTTQLDHPSAAKVLAELPSHDAIHFACHGVSDPKSPSNSALLLRPENGSEEPDRLTVEKISNTNIQRAQIAYLSACCTAENASEALADESIYIASGFQLAGFSHVLATQWVSKDDACLEVSGEFYRLLFDSQPCGAEGGHRKVSFSFHSAVKKLRDTGWKQPIKWASFIHTGA